ncbi:MAG: WG repeat-containing protein [Verrucomicrobiia bacterium]
MKWYRLVCVQCLAVLARASFSQADILILKDGTQMIGHVESEKDSGSSGGRYKLTRGDGKWEHVEADKVQRVIMGEPKAPADLGPILFQTGNLLNCVNPDGTGLRPLTGNKTANNNVEYHVDDHAIHDPTWSPDGRWVAYTVTPNIGAYMENVFAMTADGRYPRQITKMPKMWFSNPSWSPDSRRLVVEGGLGTPGIYVVNSDGTGLRLLANDPKNRYSYPQWSPDGTKIAFTAGLGISKIGVMNADGTGARILETGARATWAPDSSRLAYNWLGKIFTIKPDGSDKVDLFLMPRVPVVRESHLSGPAWSTDGQFIAYERDDAIWVVDARGNYTYKVAEGRQPSWCKPALVQALTAARAKAGTSSAAGVTGPIVVGRPPDVPDRVVKPVDRMAERALVLPSQPTVVVPPAATPAGPGQTARLYLIVQDGKYGYIDVTGRVVVAPQFTEAWEFHDGMGRFRMGGIGTGRRSEALNRANSHYGYIDSTGKIVVPATLTSAADFSDGLAATSAGYINTAGQVVLNKSQDDFSEGVAGFGGWAAQGRTSYTFVDKRGRPVCELQPAVAAGKFSEGLVRIRHNKGHSWGYGDKSGRIAIPHQFRAARDFHEGLAAVCVGNKDAPSERKWGYIDRTGQWVVPARFDEAGDFSEGLARIFMADEHGNTWRFIDRTGRIVIHSGFQFKAGNFSEGLAFALKDGRPAYVDNTGKEAFFLREVTTECGEFHGGLARVPGVGYVNKAGTYVWLEKPNVHGVTDDPSIKVTGSWVVMVQPEDFTRVDVYEDGDLNTLRNEADILKGRKLLAGQTMDETSGMCRFLGLRPPFLVRISHEGCQTHWARITSIDKPYRRTLDGSLPTMDEPPAPPSGPYDPVVVVLKDGRRFEGDFGQRGDEYLIHTSDGSVQIVRKADVQSLTHVKRSSAAVQPPPIPGPAPSVPTVPSLLVPADDGKRGSILAIPIRDYVNPAIAYSSDGKIRFTESNKGFELQDETDNTLGILEKPKCNESRHSGVFSADSKLLAVDLERTVVVWDVASRRLVCELNHEFPQPYMRVRNIQFTSDGKRLLANGGDGSVYVWEVESGKKVGRFQCGSQACFTADGRKALVGTPNGAIVCYDTMTGSELFRHDAVNCRGLIAVSGDGRRGLAKNKNGFRVLDLETGRQIRAIERGSYETPLISFDGRFVCLSGPPAFIEVDTGTERPIYTTAGPVTVSKLLNDGRHFIGRNSVAGKGQLYLCDLWTK